MLFVKFGRKWSFVLWCLCVCVVKCVGNVCNGSVVSGYGYFEFMVWVGVVVFEFVFLFFWYEVVEGVEWLGLCCGWMVGEVFFNKVSFSEKCVMFLVFL